MWYEVELIRMVNIETDSEFKAPAIQKLCRMESFEFDKDCEGTIRKFLQDNFMQDGYYLVVGESDGGFRKSGQYVIIRMVQHTFIFRARNGRRNIKPPLIR